MTGAILRGWALTIGGGLCLPERAWPSPAPLSLLRALWRRPGTRFGANCRCRRPAGCRSRPTAGVDPGYYTAIGFPVVGPRAIRVDMLDRLIARLRRMTVKGAMPPDSTIAPVLGCTKDEADAVLAALGWGREESDGVVIYRRQRPANSRPAARRRSHAHPLTHDDALSAFAVLKQLSVAK